MASENTVQQLYDEAWDRYGARCLWNVRRQRNPADVNVRIVARALRTHGDMTALRHAQDMEDALHAA